MQQQIQTTQSPEQCLAEATAFFTRRRAKVSDRTERGLRFGLEGGEAEDGGRVTVAPEGGGTTVTVEAEGLGLLAIAEGYIRELRKQARGAGRQTRSGPSAGASSGFADLRQRLGMPEPPPVPSAPRPRPRPPGPQPRVGPEASARPAPTGAGAAPAPAPQDADPANAAVASAAATQQMSVRGPGQALPPDRELAVTAGDAAATAGQRPGHDSLDAGAPSAEQLGGVPQAADVHVAETASPDAPAPEAGAVPGRETPGPGAGETAGQSVPPER
jgi:hypothetical protein